MFELNYMEWKIKEKDITKVVERNIKYCFEERKIPKEILSIHENRYEHILKYREENAHE